MFDKTIKFIEEQIEDAGRLEEIAGNLRDWHEATDQRATIIALELFKRRFKSRFKHENREDKK